MNTSDYRREYAAYCSALEHERYNYYSGLKPELYLEPIYDRYADLWTREVIADLQRTWSETPAHFETERAGLLALVRAARIRYAEASASSVTGELKRCEESARISWNETRLAARDVPHLIANETDARRRHELAARWIDALSACDDLRAARFEVLNEAAHALNFDHCLALLSDIGGSDYEKLAVSAESFLERTAPAYRTHLARWAAHTPSLGSMNNLTYADSFFFDRIASLDQFFPAHNLRSTYKAVLAGLDIRVEKQNNIRIDDQKRPTKKVRAACFGTNPPDEVHLVTNASDGANSYRAFFHEAGCAQHFGWVSRDLAGRYPEFIHAPDCATREGHAFLFEDLFYDTRWLSQYLAIKDAQARDIARSIALQQMHDIRRSCAKLRYQLALHSSPNVRSDQLAETYATLHSEATKFRYNPAMYLFDAGDLMCVAARLRARLFAATLREYLRARYGYRWWAVRAVGDELIDLWNTASRYSPEELARLVGAGDLNFDLLADTLVAAMNEG